MQSRQVRPDPLHGISIPNSSSVSNFAVTRSSPEFFCVLFDITSEQLIELKCLLLNKTQKRILFITCEMSLGQ